MATPYGKRQLFHVADARLKLTRRTFDAAGGGGAGSTAGGAVATLAGYPIVFNVNSSDRGGYVVRLAPGSPTFQTPALALHNHDFASVLGNTANGSLRVMPADAYGVPVEIDLPDTGLGRDVAELVGKGYVAGMSFSMANGFETFTTAKVDGVEVLTCTKFTVDEVTVTAIPAFVEAGIGLADDDDDDATPAAAPLRVAANLKLASARLHMARRGLPTRV